ncbi:MAG TPA: hypothetical protein PLJ46_05305 [Burkholderiaceae bacterium]|nr:hypothetical protein [Burkholderiaceae bacterium]HQZ05264.1 hypothetical protein [Burkholderiaceae bacterium]HRA62831.1 hypothetical protein [Burkholderiaceae bacterium]
MLTVAEVMETVRAAGEDGFLSPSVLPAPRLVDKVLVLLEQAAVSSLDNMSLRDLAQRTPA